MSIRILQGGLLTTVQDLGRFHYQQFGVSPGGAMDSRSLRLANLLVGNDVNEAGLEITILGPRIEFTSAAVIAVTGADLQPHLNGAPLEMYRAIWIEAGMVLSFQGPRSGCRSYLAVAGGLNIEPVMGSRSTMLKGGFGGYQGRRLQTGDEIGLRVSEAVVTNLEKRCMEPEDFSAREVTMRIILGPQDQRFTKRGVETLLHGTYCVGKDYDRMGYRLEGDVIEHATDANIISDGIALGSIQVPGNGKPIIMMADRQSTGGYTKIANVITVDIPKLAQCKEGDKISFQQVDIEEAHRLYALEFQRYEQLKKEFEAVSTMKPGRKKNYQMTVNGVTYEVTVQENR